MPETIPSLRCLPTARQLRHADALSVGPLQVRVYRDVNDVPAGEWDSLLGPDDLQTSHRFVRICQETCHEAEYWHLMAYQGEHPCGVASFSRMPVRLDLVATGMTRSLLQQPRRVWPGFLRVPVLFGGPPVSFGRPCLKLAPSAGPAVVSLLAQEAERIAKATSTQLVCFKEFDPAAAD